MKPTLLADPPTCPGGYSLHLYCKYANPAHSYNEFPHEPDGCETYAQAARKAKTWGWKLHRDGTATCPKCADALAGATSDMVGDTGIEPVTSPV